MQNLVDLEYVARTFWNPEVVGVSNTRTPRHASVTLRIRVGHGQRLGHGQDAFGHTPDTAVEIPMILVFTVKYMFLFSKKSSNLSDF